MIKRLWLRELKIITTEHTNLKVFFSRFSISKYLFQKIAATFYRFSNLSLGCSQEVTQSLSEVYSVPSSKSDTVYNSIREDFLSAGIAQFNPESFICTSGRLDPKKGFAELISSLEVYLKRTQKKLYIIGEGEDRERLEKLIEKLNLQNLVKLLGYIENPSKIIVNAWVYVSASFLEGMPLNIIEAMSLGVPVISTDCLSGPREIIALEKSPFIQGQELLEMYTTGILISVPDIFNNFEIQLNRALEVLEEEAIWRNMSLASIKRSNYFRVNNIRKKWQEIMIKVYKS